MAKRTPFADRIRAALSDEPSTREVRMFGGLAFMVNEKMTVAVHSDGDLLVRVDPDRNGELLTLPGTKPAEMGAGRAMGPGWICVAEEALATDDEPVLLDRRRSGVQQGTGRQRFAWCSTATEALIRMASLIA